MLIMVTSSIVWHKSSYSSQQGNCLEVGARRTGDNSGREGGCVEVSSDSNTSGHSANNASRVEVAPNDAVVLARDSKSPEGPVLSFGTEAWATFLHTVKSGRLDLR